jgi:hypothetical protein
MTTDLFASLFSQQTCATLLPAQTADDFFEALFGDASEGSYDLELLYGGSDGQILRFDILLKQRPGHCLACNLTYGLPQVFSRHPVINIAGIVEQVDTLLQDRGSVGDWKLGSTRELGQSTHAIPLTIELRSE